MIVKTWIVYAFLPCTILYSGNVLPHDFGHGKLKIRGSILETACNIDMNSRDQTIDLGHLSIQGIAERSHSTVFPLNIKFINCTQNKINPRDGVWSYFDVTFEGLHRNNIFLNKGLAKGIGVSIYNEKFKQETPGVPSSPYPVINGDLDVKYYIILEHNGEKLKPGDFYASIKYKVDYF